MNSIALSLTPAPLETPTSFVSRLAARNGCESMRSFCVELGLDLHAISNGDPRAMAALCSVAGLASGAFSEVAVHMAGKMNYQVGSEAFDSRTFSRVNVRVCPACLRGQHERSQDIWDKVHQLVWQIPQVISCPIHDEKLLEILGPTNGMDRLDASRAMQASWESIESVRSPKQADSFDQYLHARLSEGRCSSLCRQLSIPALWRVAEALGITLQYDKNMRRSQLTPCQQRDALILGFDLIRAGEGAIVAALTDFSCQVEKSRGHLTSPQYGELQRLLRRRFEWADDLEPFREVMRRYVLGRYPIEAGKDVFGYTLAQRRIHSLWSARKALGLSPQAFEELLLEEGLIQQAENGRILSTQPLTVDLINSLVPDNNRYLTNKDMGQLLGASETITKEISKSDVLERKARDGSLGQAGYDRKYLQRVHDQIFSETQIFDKIPEGVDTLPKITRVAKCSSTDVLGLLLEGKLIATGRLGAAKALDTLLISKRDLEAALPSPPQNGFSRTALMKRWRIGPKRLRQMIELGLLREKRMKSSCSRVTNSLVPANDVELLEQNYIFVLILLLRV